jgi:PAS domain S-box-containing protein
MVDPQQSIPTVLAALIEVSREALIALSSDGRVVGWNAGAAALFGHAAHDAIGHRFAALVMPAGPDGDALHAEVRRIADDRVADVRQLPVTVRQGDGSVREVELSLRCVQTAEHEPCVVISAHEGARSLLSRDGRAADARFGGLLEAVPDAMVIVSQDGRIQAVNGQLERLFGYPRSELLGQPVELLIPDQLRGAHRGHRARYFADPQARSMGSGIELHGRRKDGTELPIEISLSPLETDDGVLVSSTIRDVTERRRADELKLRLAAIVDSSDDAILGETLAGIITSWNQGAVRIFGYTEAEAIGQPIAMLRPAGQPPESPEVLRRLLRRERVEPFETLRRRKDGEIIHVSITISPVRDARGNVVGASKMARDISDRKHTEQALAQAKESAEATSRELEAFSYSVAHDLRAPLRWIEGFSQVLVDDHADGLGTEGRRYLGKVREAAQYMAQLIEGLLALARISQSDLRRERVDLSEIARETTRRLQVAQPERDVEIRIADGLICHGDGRLLGIALANLFGNAWKFTGKRPDPRVEFGVTRAGERDAFFVSDNGAGFDMAVAEKLFGVFQRLHPGTEFEGTGVGLATVQRVIRRHGGQIWAEAAVERGATFFFTLEDRGHRA